MLGNPLEYSDSVAGTLLCSNSMVMGWIESGCFEAGFRVAERTALTPVR